MKTTFKRIAPGLYRTNTGHTIAKQESGLWYVTWVNMDFPDDFFYSYGEAREACIIEDMENANKPI